jgi:hypothetical protein
METQTGFDLNQHVADWRNSLLASEAMDADRARELESHLREAMAELRAKGLSEKEAFSTAVRKLGEVHALAGQFEVGDQVSSEKPRAFWMDGAPSFPLAAALYLLGLALCYLFFLPVAMDASVSYSNWLGINAAAWRRDDYIRVAFQFMLGMGLGFPVTVMLLVKSGNVTTTQLVSFRKYMLVINFVLGAVLTTPEIVTQVMMAALLQLLYEFSVFLARRLEKMTLCKT